MTGQLEGSAHTAFRAAGYVAHDYDPDYDSDNSGDAPRGHIVKLCAERFVRLNRHPATIRVHFQRSTKVIVVPQIINQVLKTSSKSPRSYQSGGLCMAYITSYLNRYILRPSRASWIKQDEVSMSSMFLSDATTLRLTRRRWHEPAK